MRTRINTVMVPPHSLGAFAGMPRFTKQPTPVTHAAPYKFIGSPDRGSGSEPCFALAWAGITLFWPDEEWAAFD